MSGPSINVEISRTDSYCRSMAAKTAENVPTTISVSVMVSDIPLRTRQRLADITSNAGIWPCDIKCIGYSREEKMYISYQGWGREIFTVDELSPSAAQISQAIQDAIDKIDDRRAVLLAVETEKIHRNNRIKELKDELKKLES